MDMNKFDIWFNELNIKNTTKKTIIENYNSAEEFFFDIDSSNKLEFFDKKTNIDMIELYRNGYIDDLINNMKSEDIKYITFYNKEYPNGLKEINTAPFLLYYKGDIGLINNNKNVAIVGARKTTSYGINVASEITKGLVLNGINIISGLAEGVDAIAHNTAIKNNGYTCGIIGTGIDIVYPRCNSLLYKNILKNGCIISEFRPKTKPLAHNFPIRNRIISGISDVIVVVEAREKSGALITAGFAGDMGKDVVAVPGSIFSPMSRGTNNLIVDGAIPFIDLNSILKVLKFENSIKNASSYIKISDLEKNIFDILSDVPMHFDEIKKIIDVDISQIYNVLFEMQTKNIILSLSGNYFVKLESVK